LTQRSAPQGIAKTLIDKRKILQVSSLERLNFLCSRFPELSQGGGMRGPQMLYSGADLFELFTGLIALSPDCGKSIVGNASPAAALLQILQIAAVLSPERALQSARDIIIVDRIAHS